MTYGNPKYVNEVGGILLMQSNGIAIYAGPDSELHDRARAGEFGDVASYEPPAQPSEAEVLEALATEARAQRNALLAASDWTQVADAPVDQAAWATYRQALRDITVQAGFPETIDWPIVP